MASFAALLDEVRTAKDTQVLGDSRPGYGEGAGNVPGWSGARTQQIKDGAAGRVGQSTKRGVRAPCTPREPRNLGRACGLWS